MWNDETVEHLAELGVEPDEFEEVVSYPDRRGMSRSSNRPCCWGELLDGRYLFCVYEYLDDIAILPVTAYEVARPGDEVER